MWYVRMSASRTEAPRRGARGPAIALVLILGLAGCLALSAARKTEVGFSHAGHQKRGVSCADCHETAKKAARAGMPAADVCQNCHEGKDPLPVAAVVSAYTARPRGTLPPRPRTYADVRFAHDRHKSLDCATCHGGGTQKEPAELSSLPSMAACVRCHAERGVRSDCSVCHERLARTTAPRTHAGDWIRGHGPISRFPHGEQVADRCDLCHARNACDACHTRDPPRDHTNAFRVSAHGLIAAMDRSRCSACHRTDLCERCHQVQPPRSHRAGFGAPRSGHCTTCHATLDGSGCSVCHKGTPSHALATPKPPDHNPALNCRQCHGAGQRLPHVDNGMDCNACHH